MDERVDDKIGAESTVFGGSRVFYLRRRLAFVVSSLAALAVSLLAVQIAVGFGSFRSIDVYIGTLIAYGVILGTFIGTAQPRKSEVPYGIVAGAFGAVVNLPAVITCFLWAILRALPFLIVSIIFRREMQFIPPELSLAAILDRQGALLAFLLLLAANMVVVSKFYADYAFRKQALPPTAVLALYLGYMALPILLLTTSQPFLMTVGNIVFWATLMSHATHGPFMALQDSVRDGRRHYYARMLDSAQNPEESVT